MRTDSAALQGHDDGLTAASVMVTAEVVAADASLVNVWNVMQRDGLDLVVVSDRHGPLGVLDRQDIWTAWATDLRCVIVAAPSVAPDTGLSDVCSAVLAARHETVLVLEHDGTLSGVVTATGLLAALRRDHAESGTFGPSRSPLPQPTLSA